MMHKKNIKYFINLCKILILLCFATSCGGLSNHYDVKIDPSFSPEQRANVAQALYAWTQAVPELSFSISMEDCPVTIKSDQICIINTSLAYVKQREQSDALAFTWTNNVDQNSECYIPTDDPISQDQAAQVEIITHELGHALGLSHTGPGTIMCVSAWEEGTGCGSEFITCQDVGQYKILRGEQAPVCKANDSGM